MSHSISFTFSRTQARGQRWGPQSHPGRGQGSSSATHRGHTPKETPREGVQWAQRVGQAVPAARAPPGAVRRRCWLGLSSAEQAAREASSGQRHVVLPRATHVMARQRPGRGEVALEKVTCVGELLGSAPGGAMVWAEPCRGSSAPGAEQGVFRGRAATACGDLTDVRPQ